MTPRRTTSGSEWMTYAALGTEVAAGIATGALVGSWIDDAAGTGPYGLLGGILLVTLAVFVRVGTILAKLSRREDEPPEKRDGP